MCDGVSIREMVASVGTPLYVYSAQSIRDGYLSIDDAFGEYPHYIHYALKANSTLSILRLLRELGSRADANSSGEIEVARRAGFQPREIIFTGVGKTRLELEEAVSLDLGIINAESPGELDRIAEVAQAQGREARVAVRINPDIDAKSHPNISTGLKTNKFGVPLQEARTIYRERQKLSGLKFAGVHVHIGSQITSTEPLQRAVKALTMLALELKDDGFLLEHLDIGGGLGIAYGEQAVITPVEYAVSVLPHLKRVGIPVVLEPGRSIVGHSGALVAKVVDIKRYPDNRRFAVLDAGMGELMRPALYGSFHPIVPITPGTGEPIPWDVVGPICESSDIFSQDLLLPPLEVNDLVAILDVGAYGSVMASNYNRRLLPAEVLVDNGQWKVIRRRQTPEDVLSLEL
tara:strand:- start:456 stop:1664 length:1209 start_codon:yes stop_codon:yes gene_type:complete